MACSYIINGDFAAPTVADLPFLDTMPELPPLPPLDPLPEWTVSDVQAAPEAVAADPVAPVDAVTVDAVPYYDSPTPGVVQQVMELTGSLAFSSQTNALESIEQLATYAAAFTPVTAPAIPVTAVSAPTLSDAPAAPDLTSNFGSLPDAPAEPGAPALSVGDAPVYDVVAPSLLDLPFPDPLTAIEPVEPTLDQIAFVSSPDFTLPPVPTLVELNIPDAPLVVLPLFDSTLAPKPAAPDVAFAYEEVAYESTLLTEMNARMAQLVLTDTETGVAASVEQALQDRAAGREDALTQRAVGEASRLMAVRGISIPQATMTRIVQQALQGGLQRSASLQREIAINKAQLWQQSLRFAVESGIALESRMIDKYNEAQERALEAAKVTVSTEIAFFNAQVVMYNADVQAYGVRAQVFKTRIQAALAQLDVYRAQIDAERAKSEINVQKVAIYKSQVEAVRAVVEVYNTQVDAAKVQVSAGQSLVETYRARVAAFAAHVDAKNYDYQGYAAKMQAQAAKARLMAGQVQGYHARVTAYETLVKAKIGVQELAFKQANEFPLEVYKAKLDAYRSGTQAVAEQLRAQVSVFGAKVRAFAVQEGVKSELVDAQLAVVRANAEGAMAEASALIQAGQANLQVATQAADIAQSNVRAAGQLAGQLSAAAIAAQSVHAAITENGSYAVANHTGLSASNATSTNTLNSNSESSSNNDSVSATSGVSNNTSVTNSYGRSYNRGVSNTTSTARSVQNHTSNSIVNHAMEEARTTNNLTVSNECVDRTIHSD